MAFELLAAAAQGYRLIIRYPSYTRLVIPPRAYICMEGHYILPLSFLIFFYRAASMQGDAFDGETDVQREFLSLDLVCIPCSAVKRC